MALISTKIDAKDYYDFLPPNVHRTGDVWKGVPVFGLPGRTVTSAVVITPSCDLANGKCETLTYIPILTIPDFLSSPAFYADAWNEIMSALQKLKIAHLVDAPNRFSLPFVGQLEVARCTAQRAKSQANAHALQRLEQFCSYVRAITEGEPAPIALTASFFQRDRFETLTKRLITNAFRGDIHFLPADGKPPSTAAVQEHSVALFRHPQSAPVSVFDAAQDSTSSTWSANRQKLSERYPNSNLFIAWPIRLATLKDDFLSDLISRYVAMYVRLGSRISRKKP